MIPAKPQNNRKNRFSKYEINFKKTPTYVEVDKNTS